MKQNSLHLLKIDMLCKYSYNKNLQIGTSYQHLLSSKKINQFATNKNFFSLGILTIIYFKKKTRIVTKKSKTHVSSIKDENTKK